VTLQVQFLTIFMMFCGGLLLGTLFDVCRVLSGKLRLPKWLMPFVDILYWIVATILVFRLLVYSNEGQVRVFIFLGIGIGICFYNAFLSRGVIWLIQLLIRIVIAFCRFLRRTVELLIIKPIIGIYRFFLAFLGFLAAVAIFLYKIVLQLLYPMWRLLLWMIRPLLKLVVMPAWLTSLLKKIAGFFRRLF
jgi:spore cortex biosynthesis protein YabQ